jgi:hypothetical protein
MSSLAAGAIGIAAKSLWDSYVGWRNNTRLEKWKIRVTQLEGRLSNFYWPLYIRLLRDDNVWTKVFIDLRPGGTHSRAIWVDNIPKDRRASLSEQIQDSILVPNHVEAVRIITSNMHRAGNNDPEFTALLLKYIRHVDVYESLRSAKLNDVDPIDVGESYPEGLSAAVAARLKAYQDEYDALLRDQSILDLSRTASPMLPSPFLQLRQWWSGMRNS